MWLMEESSQCSCYTLNFRLFLCLDFTVLSLPSSFSSNDRMLSLLLHSTYSMCAPKFICWIPYSQYLRMWLFGEMALWLVNLQKEYIFTHKGIPEMCTQREKAVWVHIKKASICKPKRELVKPWSISRTSGVQNGDKINFCWLSHPVCGTQSWQP